VIVTARAARLIGASALLTWALSAYADLEPLPDLTLQDQHRTISRNVSKLIEQYHYSQPTLDNSLSSAIFDEYLDALDGSRIYFLASDVASIGRYRYQFDDRTKSGELEPAFDLFNLFRERVRQRVEQALALLEVEPDFTIDEEYQPDRSELPWPASEEAMADVWRKRVKYDAVNLMLSGETWAEAAETLKERYENMYESVKDLRATDVFDTYMNAVAHTIDPHSSYLSPRQSEEYRIQMSLSYDGIGARLTVEDEIVTVVEIIPGGPAEIDGRLKPEDRITGVGEGDEGEFVDVVGWRIDDVVDRIRGPGGTTVRLQILPAGAAPGSPQTVLALRRDKIKLEEQASKGEMTEVDLEGQTYKIGVIEVPSFYQDFAARSRGEEDYTSTSRDVARIIRELEAQGMDGLVMDLRQNGGGHLTEATELSGLFIEDGPVVQLRETPGNVQVLDDPDPQEVYDGPLVVLVDRYSASASEIFAAAIQDYQRGVIIGQQTFGKGTVQNLFDLDRYIRGTNNGQLTLTTGKYYRITGESTQHRGVTPDVELPSFIDAERIGESTRDSALPWDRIQPTRFKAEPSLREDIAELQQSQLAHAATDPNYEFVVGDIAAVEQNRDRESLSLNLAKRQAEIDEAEAARLARENERRSKLGLEPIASLEDIDTSTAAVAAEVLLGQATRMVAELAAHHSPRPLLSGIEPATATAQ
jgi:carboxyl-terminal processing protease